MDGPFRLGYVIGFANGVEAGAWATATAMLPKALAMIPKEQKHAIERMEPMETPGKVLHQYFSSSLTYGETVQGVTEICKRPENALLAIDYALEAFAMQINGKPQPEIDQYLSDKRALMAQEEKQKSK